MVKILGRNYTKMDFQRYFGSFDHLIGFKKYEYNSSRAKGLSAIEMKTGGGLSFEVLEDRGMDIGVCNYKGIPISFRSAIKESRPEFFEPLRDEWFRNYGGGLLTTCGLNYLGAPCVDNGEKLGLHGRISNTPSEELYTRKYWDKDELILEVNGSIREAKALNYNLVLNRQIKVKGGENRFFIKDKIVNEGFRDTCNMVLYHFNIGHPVLDLDSKLYLRTKEVVPRDEIASNRWDKYNEYLAPTKDYPDVVYYHSLEFSNDSICKVAFVNHNIDIGIYIKYNSKTLPYFTQWKFTGEGNYVTGLEPGNCRVNGRDIERRENRLKILKPYEEVSYEIEFGIIDGKENIDRCIKDI